MYKAKLILLSEPQTCTQKDFHCSNGDCMSARFWCDGDYDCADGSDEVMIFKGPLLSEIQPDRNIGH